jgi:type VII secretion integral membrane protein EccD
LVAPGGRVDVALPVDIPLAALMPTLLRQAGSQTADRGAAQGGWTVQRFGDRPLDLGRSARGLVLREGELLFLRPSHTQLPELAYDDVVDAVATAARQRTSRWGEPETRWAGLSVAAVTIVLLCAVLLRIGPPWPLPAVLAGVVALESLLVALILSRVLGDARAGAVLGFAGLAPGALAGAAAVGLGRPPDEVLPASLLGGGAAVLVLAVLIGMAVVDLLPVFLGVALAALTALVAGLLQLAMDVPEQDVAAIALVLVLALTPLAPRTAARLAGLPMPFIPLSADDLKRDESAVLGAQVLRQAQAADRFVTGMVAGTSLVVMGASLLLARHGGWPDLLLIGLAAAVVALRARVFLGRGQRLWLFAAAVLGAVEVALGLPAGHGQVFALLVVVIPLLLAAIVLIAVTLHLQQSRLSPPWGRAADILESVLVISVVPVALAAAGAYQYVRGLGG